MEKNLSNKKTSHGKTPFFSDVNLLQEIGVKQLENCCWAKTFCSMNNQSGQQCPFPGVPRCKHYKIQKSSKNYIPFIIFWSAKLINIWIDVKFCCLCIQTSKISLKSSNFVCETDNICIVFLCFTLLFHGRPIQWFPL